MNDKGNLIDARPPFLPTFIGTGFGSGFWPWGPGTAGSVAATVIWIVLGLVLPADTMWLQAVTWALAIVFTPIGTWATAWCCSASSISSNRWAYATSTAAKARSG